MSARVLIVIPARYASTRYPGKPLVPLRGAGGEARSLIHRSWLAAEAVAGMAEGDAEAVVATDDARIAREVERFGGRYVMTSSEARNGTERCAEALEALGGSHDLVVNLQGDAPLTPPWFVEALIEALEGATGEAVATPVLRCTGAAHRAFLEDRAAGRVGGTTAVFDREGRALYFSKEVIPFTGRLYDDDAPTPVFHHVGVYAYTPAALKRYRALPQAELEALEGLEQLRFLENGMTVQCVEVDARGREFWELNNPEDVPRIEAVLKRQNMP